MLYQAQENLLLSEQRLSFHLENTPLGFIEWDEQLQVKHLSKNAEKIFGWTLTDFNDHERRGFNHVYSKDKWLADSIATELLSGAVLRNTVQFRNITKDGRIIWCEWFNSVLKDKAGKVTSILSLMQDITERREARKKIDKLTDLYAFISQVNKDIVHVKNEATLFRNSCNIATELGHFKIAWIGLFDSTYEYINLVAQNGLPDADIQIFTKSPVCKEGPVYEVLRTENYYTCHDVSNDIKFDQWKPFIERHGIHSCMILPLKKSGAVIGTFNLYTTGYGFNDSREIEILVELAEDISFALERFERIRKQKETEELVINNEKKFRHTLDNMLEGVQMHDFDWRYIYVNDALVKYSPYSREEMIGYTLMEKYPGIEQTDLYKTMHRCLYGRAAEQLETEFVFPDGRVAYFELIINPIPEGISVLSVDRTEQRAAKESVEENETRFRALIENGTDMITLSTVNGEMLYASPSVTKVFGYTLEEIRYVSAFDFIHPDDLEKFLRDRRVILQENRKSCYSQLRLLHKNGNWIWCEATLTNMLEEKGIHSLVSNFRDITERKNAEQAQAESKKLIQTIYGACPDAVIIINALGAITKWDEKSEALFGWKETEVINKNLAETIIPGRDHRRYQAKMQHYLETEEGTIPGKPIDIPVLKKNGCELEVSLSLTPTQIDGSIHFIGFIRDISDKKTAEKQKEFDKNNLNALINNTADLMWSVDTSTRLITFNEPFYKTILVVTGKEIAKGDEILSAAMSEQQQDRFKRSYARAFAGEAFTEIEHIETPVNSWLEISYYPIREGNEVIGTACHSRDITDRKKSEENLKQSEKRYRQIVETAQEGIWLIDENNKTVFVNKRFSEIFGYSFQEMSGKTNFDLLDEEGKAIIKEKIERRKQGIAEDFEQRYIGKTGQEIWVNVSASPITGDNGNYIGGLAMLTDITERKMAEKEKEKMRYELEKSREQEQLAITDAVITGEEKARQEMGLELHDNINQILATAQLYLGLFLKKNPAVNDLIQKTDEMIIAAIKEIRDLAHSTISPFIGDDSLPEALETLAMITERSGAIKITRKFTNIEEIPMPEKLKLAIYRIVQEQFQNILKYAKTRNVYMEMHCEQCMVSLLVRDDGVGFDTSQKANGIGMKNIQTRISLYQGEMKIVSSPGNGCSLTVKCHYPCI